MDLDNMMSYELLEAFLDTAISDNIILGKQIIHHAFFNLPQDFVEDVFLYALNETPYEAFSTEIKVYYLWLKKLYPRGF